MAEEHPPPIAALGLRRRVDPIWVLLFGLSGLACLVYETVWLRRLALVLGGSAVSSTVTLATFMAGLALGSLLVGAGVRRLERWSPARISVGYGGLEGAAALWALGFPVFFGLVAQSSGGLLWVGCIALLLVPATCLGATWPLVARVGATEGATALYVANTVGAVLGVLAATFVLLPTLGVRGTELLAASLGGVIALVAVVRGLSTDPVVSRAGVAGVQETRREPIARWRALLAVAVAGLSALGLEVVWFRLAGVALGASVQTFGVVLATFLAAVSAGAWLGGRWPSDPHRALGLALGGLGLAALGGAMTWGFIPYGVAGFYVLWGPDGLSLGAAVLAAIAMGGAPVASGMVFSLAVRATEARIREDASALYIANTAGAIAGAATAGLMLLPALEMHGTVVVFAVCAALAGWLVSGRPAILLACGFLALVQPGWDARLYAVGLHLAVSDFASLSPVDIRRFADEGWDLLSYEQGMTAAVAVGESRRSGNRWLSINGKVDASTGDDMPTQELSGELPLRVHGSASEVLLVGLASGVTAGAVLRESTVEQLTVLELEPSVVAASRFFDHVSGAPLDDARTRVVIDDARSFLQQSPRTWDVIISEPSNPWITGVSNLFTREYWALVSERLRPDGVFCQWVQLYGMGPDEFQGLVRTLADVFPRVWLFETISGSDILLIAARQDLPEGLPVVPVLDPMGVRRLAGAGWLNTDDHPRVEWNAPAYLHRDTAEANASLIREAQDEGL